jgi:hypothetical protein
MHGTLVIGPLLKLYVGGEVVGSIPVYSNNIFSNEPDVQPMGATWQPMSGPRGTSSFASKVPHVNL